MIKYPKQLSFDFVKENKNLFEYVEVEFQYILEKRIDCRNHVALFLDVFKDNGFQNAYKYNSEGREWVLVPKEIADEMDYIKITFDGYITAEKIGEIVLLGTAGAGYDDVLTSQIFFLGQRCDSWHDLNEVATLINFEETKLKKMSEYEDSLLRDDELDKLLNKVEEFAESPDREDNAEEEQYSGNHIFTSSHSFEDEESPF